MNAVEFFKTMKYESVKKFIDNGNIRNEAMHHELKRLVESYELVKSVGGIDSAKANISEMINDSGEGYVSDDAKLYDYDFSFGMLRKAIADVEKCQ